MSGFRGDIQAAMDRLPPAIRKVLHEAVIEWDPRAVRWRLNKLIKTGLPEAEAIQRIVTGLRSADAREIAEFSQIMRGYHGHPSPHVSAGVSPLRYDEAARVAALRSGAQPRRGPR